LKANKLYRNPCDAHRRLEVESLVWEEIVEQNLLDGCLSSPIGKEAFLVAQMRRRQQNLPAEAEQQDFCALDGVGGAVAIETWSVRER